MALTEKQKRFVEEYLVDLNATQAAIRAGYSEKNADKIGPELLGKTRVSEAVQKAMNERSVRTEITQDRVLRELAAIGFAKATDYAKVTESGVVEITPTSQLTDDQRRAVSGIKEGKYGVEVSSHDKIRALELLGKHLGMFDARATQNQGKENNLLDRLVSGTEEEMSTDDLPEVQ